MNPAPSTEDWTHDSGEYPGIQHLDLHGGLWAEIGPRGRRPSDGWWWAVAGGIEVADSGCASGEDEAKAAVADWAEDDLLVAEITGELLSGAFAVYGHTDAAVARAALAVAATTQIRRN